MDIGQFRNAARRSHGLAPHEPYEVWAILEIESFERELEVFHRRALFAIAAPKRECYARD